MGDVDRPLVGEEAVAGNGEGAAAQVGVDRSGIDDAAGAAAVLRRSKINRLTDIVYGDVRCQRKRRSSLIVVVVNVIVSTAAANVDGGVAERLAPLRVQLAATSPRQVDGPASGAVDPRQRQPVRHISR